MEGAIANTNLANNKKTLLWDPFFSHEDGESRSLQHLDICLVCHAA